MPATATWTTPIDWSTGLTVTASMLQSQVANNMQYIYDNSGTVVGKRVVILPIFSPTDAVGAGTGVAYIPIPIEYNGYNIINAQAAVVTAATAGIVTSNVIRVRGTEIATITTTAITIDPNETTSYTAAVPSAVGTANDDVATGDFIRWDNTVAGTIAYGQYGIFTFQLP
jgi:hypothetical protein